MLISLGKGLLQFNHVTCLVPRPSNCHYTVKVYRMGHVMQAKSLSILM